MKLRQALFVLIALLPVIYLGIIWQSIPESVPTHFNSNGPNGWSSKLGFFGIIAFMSAVSIGTYLLVVNIHKIDPKRVGEDKAGVFGKIASGIILFLTALNVVVIQSGLHPEGKLVDKALLPLIGLMFVFLGNYMHNLKPNYFVGIRIPWALNDEENWKQTHRIGGRVWVIGGIIITITSLFTSLKTGNIIMQIVLAVMVLVPVIFSYTFFRKQLRNKQL